MSKQPDPIPDNAVFIELDFGDGTIHRVPATDAREWLAGTRALGLGRGEPMVTKDGRLIEHHGLPADDDLAAELSADERQDPFAYDSLDPHAVLDDEEDEDGLEP